MKNNTRRKAAEISKAITNIEDIKWHGPTVEETKWQNDVLATLKAKLREMGYERCGILSGIRLIKRRKGRKHEILHSDLREPAQTPPVSG
jgi:hypothetical protein